MLYVMSLIIVGIGIILLLILSFGAMPGKLIEESGAPHTITYRLIDLMGPVRNLIHVQLKMSVL